jgi:hypothetical protein
MTIDRQALQRRAEVAMWGSLACAQPWFVAGSKVGLVFAAMAFLSWLVARLAGSVNRHTDFVQRAFYWWTRR